jgi:cytochrome c
MARQRLAKRGLVARRGCSAGAVLFFLAALAGPSDGHGADIELGRYLSSECMTCHGAAQAHSQIPEIFGMAETTFTEVVKAYREKRLHNPVMQNIAGRLNDEDIAALAAYFATTKRTQ